MKSSTKEELQELVNHIEDSYTGDYASVSYELYKAVYYLNYVESGLISSTDRQETCFVLHRLAECFHKAHRKRIQHQYEVISQVVEELEKPLSAESEDKTK